MASLIYRLTSTPDKPAETIVKESPLTILEVDGNFKSIQDDLDDKLTLSGSNETVGGTKTFTSTIVADSIAVGTTDPIQPGSIVASLVIADEFNLTSDLKLKENVNPIDNPLEVINQIEGVSFTWKETGSKSYGVIAQQIEKVLPELVSKNNDTLSVSYIPLIAFLIEAIKQQNVRISQLENKQEK
jgi:hypothetical protein